MADANKQRLAQLHQRLAASREQLVELSHSLKGDAPVPADGAEAAESRAGFPRSRLMRALLGRPGRLLLAGLSVVLPLWGPRLVRRAGRLAPLLQPLQPLLRPLLRPLLLRYVLPRLLGER